MSFPSRTMRKIVVAAAVSAVAAMFGYAYGSQPSPSVSAALAKSSGGLSGGPAAAIAKRATSGIWGPGSAGKGGIPYTLIQTTPTTVQVPDATSAATGEATGSSSGEAKGAAEASSEVVSGASEESVVKDAAYCLKCHGPFEKLAERTKDYVTEWDESANPHVYVPHDSKSIVECSECHDPHPIPFAPSENARKPNVDYCYSCHHAQTLVNCNQCHNE